MTLTTPLPHGPPAILLAVSRSHIVSSPLVLRLMSLLAEKWRLRMEPGLLSWKYFCILSRPKTYIWPLPNFDSLVPTARRDWTGSYARQLCARVSLAV